MVLSTIKHLYIDESYIQETILKARRPHLMKHIFIIWDKSENKCNPKSVAFNMKDEKTQKAARTFFSPQILLTVCFPLRELASSMISSCTRLAVWIISAIKAMARWLACTFLVNRKQCFLTEMPPNNLLSNHLVKSGHWI